VSSRPRGTRVPRPAPGAPKSRGVTAGSIRRRSIRRWPKAKTRWSGSVCDRPFDSAAGSRMPKAPVPDQHGHA